MRIGFFTDLHLRDQVPGTSPIERRKCRLMKSRLRECAAAFKAAEVDLVVCAGDVVDTRHHENVPLDLAAIRGILDDVGVPVIAVAGNHDPYPGVFYEVFDEPDYVQTMQGYCLITCVDALVKGEEFSRRTDDDMARFKNALAGPEPDNGLTIIFQHYLVYPDRSEGYPHNYANNAQIMAEMEASGRKILCISGHYHPGFDAAQHRGVTYFVGKAMC